ncbi:MAG TPA: hypothetical protein VD757_01440, partial [Candidatus Nitrosocosmicus sp.]|nr:hypothetical protein [Candidatus Nitrosocosmicus sp.]
MKQIEKDIKSLLHNNLDKAPYENTFTNVWAAHLSSGRSGFKYRRAAFVPMILIITMLALFTVGYAGLSRLTDNVDLPFADDPQVIGKWETVDFVDEISDFDPSKKSFEEELYLTSLVFIESGKMLDGFENGNLYYSDSTWTKGTIINPIEQIASKYEIKEISGGKYMFMEWKNEDYTLRFLSPKYYVLRQVDNKDYANFAPVRIQDNIDYEFVDNPEMLGLWTMVDTVRTID